MQTPDEQAPSHSSLLDIAVILAKRKKLILLSTFCPVLIAALISLMWPHTYTAATRLMPPQQSQSLATVIAGQLGLAAGGLAAGGLGLKNPSDLYVSMLRGRTIADAVISRFKLKELYSEDLDADARRALEKRVSITASRDGIIAIEVDDRDPTRAAEIANAFVEELDRLTFNIAIGEAGQRRLFFEKQLKGARENLLNAEIALRTFLEGSGLVLPEGQAQLAIAAAARIRAEIAAKEVQLSTMKSFATAKNPEVILVEGELAALREQLSRIAKTSSNNDNDVSLALRGLPAASQTFLQRMRELKYNEAVFELLLKQYEIAKVEEAKNATLIQVIDRAVPPDKRSWPKRTLIVLIVFVAALMGTLIWIMIVERIARNQATADRVTELLRLLKWSS